MLSACSKLSSQNTKMDDIGTKTCGKQVAQTDYRSADLPNSNAAQTLLCTFYRSPNVCGVIHQRQSVTRVQPPKLLAPQARRKLQSTRFIHFVV